MDDGLKRDIARYLTQRAERGCSLMVSPAQGVDRLSQTTNSGSTDLPQQTLIEPSSHKPPSTVQNVDSSDNVETADRGAPEPDYENVDVKKLVDPFSSFTDLDAFNKAIQGCQKCPLGATRNKFVFGVGDPKADLVLVGEAPGANEDQMGEPFVGRAGKLLDQILAAVDLKRGENVYICNILKCRPPNNRDPQPDEVHECEPHLLKQLQLLQPKLIVALGRIAAQTLLRTKESLTKLREQDLVYHGIPLIVTYHPAALLRNPNWKRPTWEDVQKMKRMLDEANEI